MKNLAVHNKVPYICSALTDIRLTAEELQAALTEFLPGPRAKNVRQKVLGLFADYTQGEGLLAALEREKVRQFKLYLERIGVLVEGVVGVRPFIPHQHFDPVLNASATPQQVRESEGRQIQECTSCLLVVANHPSWGGGMEVAWAEREKIPTIIMRTGKVSRLLLGNLTLSSDIIYENEADLHFKLAIALRTVFHPAHCKSM